MQFAAELLHPTSDKKSMNKSDVIVRLASFADYEDVQDINRNVYAGFDYLPAMYHELLHNPHNVAVVAEVKGKVVGIFVLEAYTEVVFFFIYVNPITYPINYPALTCTYWWYYYYYIIWADIIYPKFNCDNILI